MDQNVFKLVEENFVISELVREIGSGIDLIGSISEEVYRAGEDSAGSIGGHFRHNLDFVSSFLNGLAERRIDYSNRMRDVRVEQDQSYAISSFRFASRRIRNVSDELFESMVLIRSEIDASKWHASSVARETEFVLSHTVHHHALIAEKLKCLDLPVAEGFGVSSSTLRFWAQKLAA